ncbi:hypothetical protein RRG08_033734 [Elysia crispata]|uniref:Uncharacterized protein n=1 Tax=Elysia crispata TaxID=231223 RepID=A0AAE1AB82_9GAST|nr:hypothetical protein RRG08_033734 [Elysia crispata]
MLKEQCSFPTPPLSLQLRLSVFSLCVGDFREHALYVLYCTSRNSRPLLESSSAKIQNLQHRNDANLDLSGAFYMLEESARHQTVAAIHKDEPPEQSARGGAASTPHECPRKGSHAPGF